ncbi:MAG: DUF3048 domain-containing protein [Actinomycetota bacterium]
MHARPPAHPIGVSRRLLAGVALAATMTAACGSGSDDSAPTDSTLASSLAFSETTTTTAPTTTTTTAPTTTTTTRPQFHDPLTGLGRADASPERSALAVKIDNHPSARPQAGLSSADIVFDLRAEGVTRFMAVFHSEVPAEVGPVRSSRTSDFDLLRGLDNPLYASSGGNAYVMGQVPSLPIFAVTNHTRREYYRDGSRPAPHNLFVDPETLYGVVGDRATATGAPEPWFVYRADAEEPLPVGARPVEGVRVDFTNSPTVDFAWDETAGGWLRSQDGAPHLDASGQRLAPENVVIMVTSYGVSAADPASPEVRSVGTGDLIVLTDGHRIDGTWERTTAESKPLLLSSDGEPIALTPGRTWVLFPEAGQVTEPGS